jgi:hypothetical protein
MSPDPHRAHAREQMAKSGHRRRPVPPHVQQRVDAYPAEDTILMTDGEVIAFELHGGMAPRVMRDRAKLIAAQLNTTALEALAAKTLGLIDDGKKVQFQFRLDPQDALVVQEALNVLEQLCRSAIEHESARAEADGVPPKA